VGKLKIRALQLASVAACLTGWEGAVRLGLADPLFVPAPSAVMRAALRVSEEALPRLAQTLGKTLAAYALAVGIGVGLGIVIGSVRYLYDVLNPFLVVLYGIPKILILPWILLIFGIGVTPAIVYATLHGVFPIMLLVIGGVRDVDRALITVARSMGARTGQVYRKVILPAILPSVLAGMRLGIVFSLLGVLVVEMFAGIGGMGYVLLTLSTAFRAADLFAATALVSALSIAVVLALESLNKRLSQWR
jgi:NitT/TauT family transport system permease protein